MPFSIRYNPELQLAMRELNGNNNKATKNLKEAASEQKVNSAQDDAAGYSVSEKMNVQMRALNQDKENIQNGAALLKIARGGRKYCRHTARVERTCNKRRHRYKYRRRQTNFAEKI